MRIGTRRLLGVVLLAPLFLFGAAVSVSAASTHVKSYSGTVNVGVASAASDQYYNVLLGTQYGIFAKYGLSVDYDVLGSATLTAAVASGAVEFTVDAAPALDLGYAAGVPVKLLATGSERNSGFLLVAAAGIKNPAECGTIGQDGATTPSTILGKYALYATHVPAGTVRFVLQTASTAEAGLVSHQYGCIVGTDTGLNTVESEVPGSGVAYNYNRMLYSSYEVWGYMPWVTRNKAETVDFLKALNATIVKWESDPTDAEHLISVNKNISSPNLLAVDYASTKATFNKGPIALHVPSTQEQSFLMKVLRIAGFSQMVNRLANKGNMWTPTYWDDAFSKS